MTPEAGSLYSGDGSTAGRVGCPPDLPSSARSGEAKRKKLGRVHFTYRPYPPDSIGPLDVSSTRFCGSDIAFAVI
jgi:hypothetical protein